MLAVVQRCSAPHDIVSRSSRVGVIPPAVVAGYNHHTVRGMLPATFRRLASLDVKRRSPRTAITRAPLGNDIQHTSRGMFLAVGRRLYPLRVEGRLDCAGVT